MKNRKVIGAACAAALAVGLIGTAAVPAAAAGPDTTYLVLAPQGKSTAKAAARARGTWCRVRLRRPGRPPCR